MGYTLFKTPPSSAFAIMAKDAALLATLDRAEKPIVHFYDWQDEAATYGHFVKPADFLDLEEVKKHKLDLGKRPTGGGIVFHNCDLAFSVLVPAHHPTFSAKPLDNYHFINGFVSRVIASFLGKTEKRLSLLPIEPTTRDVASTRFCMAKATRYDVMLEGKKVGGAAQRKTRLGYLHQGSIFLGELPLDYLNHILLPGTEVIANMRANATFLLGKSWTQADLAAARESLKSLLEIQFKEAFK